MFSIRDVMLYLAGRRRNPIVFDGVPVHAYSQRGEDLIIDGLLEGKKTGFYVDVGANHPTHLSNTKRFYDRGWRGINIEPNPVLAELLFKEREHDVCQNIGIGRTKGLLPFYVLSSHTDSTFSIEDAHRNCLFFNDCIERVINVPVEPLSEVLNRYNPEKIDFMSIDTEGAELEVLKTNDWRYYRPTILCVEIENDPNIVPYLASLGYVLVFSNSCNGIFWGLE